MTVKCLLVHGVDKIFRNGLDDNTIILKNKIRSYGSE